MTTFINWLTTVILPTINNTFMILHDGSSALKLRMSALSNGSTRKEVDFDDGNGYVPWGDLQAIALPISLKGVAPTDLNVIGTFDEIIAGLVADDVTNRSLGKRHLAIIVNSLTGTGTVTITGDSVDGETGVPTTGDTEIITIDEIANYQSAKKWAQISSVVFSVGISAINYDLNYLGYEDYSNNDFLIGGYRADVKSEANNMDFTLEIIKVKDLGSGKFELIDLEKFEIDSEVGNGSWIDHVRTGGDDRSVTFNQTAAPSGTSTDITQGDFYPYFGNECRLLGATKDEGFILRITGQSGVDSATIELGIIKTT